MSTIASNSKSAAMKTSFQDKKKGGYIYIMPKEEVHQCMRKMFCIVVEVYIIYSYTNIASPSVVYLCC